MAFSSKRCAGYLEETRLIFVNLPKAPHISAELINVGFGDIRINEGKGYRGSAKTLFRKYLDKRQERIGKGKQVTRKFRKVKRKYSNNVSRLRKELVEDPQTYEELALTGNRDRSLVGLTEQIGSFYNIAMKPEVIVKIEPFGFTAETLQADFDELEEYRELRADYEKLKGECQSLIEERDKAFNKLRAWMGAFVAACKVAFEGSLQTLEEIGIFIRNRPKPKEKKPETPGTPETPSTTNNTTGTADPTDNNTGTAG
ncbi:MAG: hypothetical protein GY950_10750 [bacterium]|nr:hypothetical protein [bacterium]